MKDITITSGNISLNAELIDNATAQAIWDALPIENRASTWGDEVYFTIPVNMEASPDARADVDVGELAYWPTGSAFCIFFGPTPASSGPRPRAASPVNVFGVIQGDPTAFKKVRSGDHVQITRAIK